MTPEQSERLLEIKRAGASYFIPEDDALIALGLIYAGRSRFGLWVKPTVEASRYETTQDSASRARHLVDLEASHPSMPTSLGTTQERSALPGPARPALGLVGSLMRQLTLRLIDEATLETPGQVG